MIRKPLVLGAVAAFALAGAAVAQTAPAMSPPSDSVNPPAVAPADADARATPPMAAEAAAPPAAASASAMGADVSTTASMSSMPVAGTVTVSTLTNGPVPDNAENRAKYAPLSHAGKMSRAKGD